MVNKNTMNEKYIEQHLVAHIRNKGGLCIKLLSNHFTGLPDRLCLLPGGALIFVETKATGKTPRPRQIIVHSQLRKLGFRVEVIDSLDQIVVLCE